MAATEASATTGMCLERLERVAELCRSYVDRGYMPCTDILISRRGNRWLRSTHGLMDVAKGVPLRDDALFRIYSMTKPLTCIAAMICYERGNFAMDDPVGLHLPEFADMDVLVGSSDHATITSPLSAATPLTIAHCFTHTNGLGGPRPAGTKGSSDDGAAAAAPSSLAEAVARDSTRPLIFVPGTKWKYSGGHDVLGRLIEVWTGRPYEDFLRDEVLIPLGMHDTGFRVPSAQRHRLVTPYRHATEGEGMAPGLFYRETEQDNRYHHQGDDAVIVGDYPYPSGGLISSVADYARFAQMLLDGGALPAAGGGGALLGRRTVQFIGTNLLPMVSGVAGADCGLLGAESDRPKPGRSNTNGGPGIGFGLGMAVVSDSSLVPYPCSNGEIYWVGAASTHFWVDFKEEVVVVFMSQLLPWTQYNYMRELRVVVNACFTDMPRL